MVDWFNGKSDVVNMMLDPWQRKIRAPRESFEDIIFTHIHKEFNQFADHCSNEFL